MMAGQGNQIPILILREGTKREKGKDAQSNNINAAMAIANAVKTTLGPRGMDKMLVDGMGDVVITNDGVTILKEMEIEHPAAKMIVEVAKTQDSECGDGTTTAVILAGELLKNAQQLISSNVHPTVVTRGYKDAANRCMDYLDSVSIKISPGDKETLQEIAATAMSSKGVAGVREQLAKIAVDAVTSVAELVDGSYHVDDDDIQLVKKQGGGIGDTMLLNGIIIDKEPVHSAMPRTVKNAKIAVIDAALEIKKTELDSKIEITDPSQLRGFLDEEEGMLKSMVESIKKAGANTVFCQKGIDDIVQHFLAKEGIFAVRRVKKSDMEKLAKATGANIVTRLNDLSANDLGHAATVEARKIQDDELTFVTGCKNPKSVSVLLRGGSEHVVDELERSLIDAISVVALAVEDGKMVAGGGATAIELSQKLSDYATSVGGREQMAIEAFANALEVIPTALAENAGMDTIDILIELRSSHKAGNKYHGVDVLKGRVADMRKEKVLEPLRVGRQAIQSAADAASMILRIDDVISVKSSAPGGKTPPGGYGEGGDED
ncbi:MAG: TCP-1/cpn60 chaperonin family protein [Thermoplasmata archaeon]|nr:TCP-1/cpn60 chaperonin family protein [Candidatus Sysuiplasma acidicola]MBX8636998.1 TCP-1/cpn60 chaperonin family protein [Candidatus Sysuiplasma acidicola]MBX8645352.1 TCP-1/cpn60 chaperonin family protein [Candidatus Sysuiplasma acidicola]MDH2906104.1 thermosome subunit beta [Methanomassiliicoccales archaeon]